MITYNNDESTKKRGVIKIKIEDADSKPSTSQKHSEEAGIKTEDSTMSPAKDPMFPIIEMPVFNEPKLEGAGEDADPISLFDEKSGIGLVCVFDGLGGAGARIYKDNRGEEHTAAYIASRLLRKIVNDLFTEKVLSNNLKTAQQKQSSQLQNNDGNLPEGNHLSEEKPQSNPKLIEENSKANDNETSLQKEYLEDNLIQEFLIALDPRSLVSAMKRMAKNYSSINESAFDSLSSEFPTTMAGCVYCIDKDRKMLELNCFWAGDSRVYLFDVEKLHFLTKDDADAPDGDPFSPENMDLKMSQYICLDKPFTIHFDSKVVKYSAEAPVLLMAATDGCFGYFRNPILFEKMVRESLLCDNKDLWTAKTKQAIIDNGRHDDLSMAAVIVGTTNVKKAGEVLSNRLKAGIFSDYEKWTADFSKQRIALQNSVEALMQERIQLLSEIKRLHSEIEANKAVNEEILAKRKEIADMEALLVELKEKLNKILENKVSDDELKNSLLEKETLKREKDKAWEAGKSRLEEVDLTFKQENNDFYKKYKEGIV